MFDKSKTFVMMRSDYSAVLGGEHGWNIDHDFEHAWRVAQNYPGKIVTFETAEYILQLRRELDEAVKAEREACAKIAVSFLSKLYDPYDVGEYSNSYKEAITDLAVAIRARNDSSPMS